MGSFDELLEEKKEIKKDGHLSKLDEIDRVLAKHNITEKVVDFEPEPEPDPQPEKQKTGYFDKVKSKMDQQKKTIKTEKKPKPKFEKEPEWTDEEKKTVKKKFIEKVKAGRKERKRIMAGEHNRLIDAQKFVIGFAFIAVMFVFLMFTQNPDDQSIQVIVLLLGCSLFLPLGMILGWVFLDPFMRCKIMRKMTKGRKNFGIVNFVGKGKKIVTRIKNFDEDLIWIKNKCWALTKSGIYELDKDGEQATEKQALDPDSFVTVTESVPTMFIDINSMQPLTFEETGREGIAPEELGSTLKGWVDNQMAKVMFLKRSLDMYFLIVILCSIASAYFGYINNQKIIELEETIKQLGRQINQMIIMPPFNFF